MKISAALMLLSEHDEVLLLHVTQCPHWDLPKGGIEEGETPLQAVIREVREETSIELLNPDGSMKIDLLELGEMAYIPRKRIHVFAARVPHSRVTIEKCFCQATLISRITQMEIPEADAFRWTHLSQVKERCAKSMGKLLTNLSSRPEVVELPVQEGPALI